MDSYLLISLEIVLLIVLICGSGFFSSCEMALFSLSRAKVMAYRDDPSPAKRRIYFLLDNYNRTLVSIILSNMFVNSCINMRGFKGWRRRLLPPSRVFSFFCCSGRLPR